MKILLTGGGTGGHFYPLIAIAERINTLSREKKLLEVDLYYMSNGKYDEKSLTQNNISFVYVPTGKLRLYPSIKNVTDSFKIVTGIITACFKMFFIYPDVVISKGGHGAVPALFAARLLKIPIIIHESDTYPGRTNVWSGKFAKLITLAYKDNNEIFDKNKTAVIGLPIRNELLHVPAPSDGAKYYGLDEHIPTIFVYAGSLGAEKINNLILESLPELLKSYQIIHQCGIKNEVEVRSRTSIILEDHPYKNRYIIKPFLDVIDTRHAAAIASLVIARGNSTLFEVAAWKIPAIVIPITKSNGNHQHTNAVAFVSMGAGVLLEEQNALSHLFISKINEILLHPDVWQKMHNSMKDFGDIDAAVEIAREAILIGESHEIDD